MALIVVLMLTAAGAATPAPVTTATATPAPAAAPQRQLPPGELGKTIELGRRLFDETGTQPLTKAFVRNALSCSSCHPGAGAAEGGSTLLGAATAYPAWSPRERAVITLEDRVLNCFMRSMNGMRPANGSRPAVAITAYLTWLSTGSPVSMNPRAPTGPRSFQKVAVDERTVDLAHGRDVYAARCAECHGADGNGDLPVWGPRSYNAGAGLADVSKLAGFVRATMPPGDAPVSEKEAVDVAAFIDSQPRPDFRLRDHLARGATYNSNVRDEVVRAPTWPRR